MDGEPISRRRVLRASAAAGAWTLMPPVAQLASALQTSAEPAPLRVGVGVADLTPELGGTFFGYVRPDRTATGVAVRLFARAIVLDDGSTRLAIVTVDLGASLDKAGVVERLADIGYGMENVVIAPTHTHAGPEEWTDWLEAQIAASIRRADADLGPARAAWARASLDGVNVNRAVEAHLANHGFDIPPYQGDPSMDPEGIDHPRDLQLRMLRIDRASGEPLVGWGMFAVHPTNFPNTNTLFSADLSGLAVRHFEQSFDDRAGRVRVGGGQAPVGILANSNEGDLISLYESHNPHSSADLMGRRLARRMRELWEDAGSRLSRQVPVGLRWTRILYEGQEVDEGKPVADAGLFGVPFLGGARNGPSPFYEAGLEGTRRPAEAADPVHGRKVIASPAPWRRDPELQVLRIGSTMLVAVPGEATVEAGRRIVSSALSGAPSGVDDAAVLGLTNDYVGYFTTPEEYDQQHYEGGHTVFGKWSSLLVIQSSRQLSEALASDQPAPPPGENPFQPRYPPQGGQGGAVGGGAAAGTILTQPPCEVQRLELVEVTWEGGPDGHDRPVDAPFVLLERSTASGWTPVDSDLGDAFQWTEEDGTYWARHDIAPDLELGTYRLRINAARYQLTTEPFEVTANRRLIVRGVEGESTGDGTRLTFRAQHPPPDPERHMRYRDIVPPGGSLRFRHADEAHEASWDPAAGGWVATVAGEVSEFRLDAGALVDGVGNTNGASVTFRVGDVANIEWPPDMEVGGTGRDWHAHAPSQAADGRDGTCPADGGGSPRDEAPDDREEDAAASSGERTLPATGAGSATIGAALALGAAQMARRSERPPTAHQHVTAPGGR